VAVVCGDYRGAVDFEANVPAQATTGLLVFQTAYSFVSAQSLIIAEMTPFDHRLWRGWQG
jgi:hypothetical protein